MGLDICVRRLIKEPKNKNNYFRLVDENTEEYDNCGFPDWTKEFEHVITEQWYDWEKYKEQTGIDITQMDCYNKFYGKEECFMTVFPKGKELPQWSQDYPGGWDAYKDTLDKITIKIDLEKVPTKPVTIKVIYWKEVGYQRKGLNGNFYDDYDDKKIGYWVWTKAELERYKEEYCDEPYEYVYPNGEKSGDMVYPKDNFQKNIINHFEEGKDCVIFDW